MKKNQVIYLILFLLLIIFVFVIDKLEIVDGYEKVATIIFATISSIAVGIQAFYAQKNYELLEKQNNANAEMYRRNKAVKLAEYFRKEILPLITYISIIYSWININDELNKIEYSQLQAFTKEESGSLYSEKLFNSIMEAPKIVDKFNLCRISLFVENLSIHEKDRHYSIAKINTNKLKKDIGILEKEIQNESEIEKIKLLD